MAETSANPHSLLAVGPFADYNPDERRYSVHVRETMLQLLKGDRDRLDILTKYHRDPSRLGALPVPKSVNPKALRLSKVEEILSSAVCFLHDGSAGGPIAQLEDRDRRVIIQRRDFPTRFPHIVVQRTDTYDVEKGEPLESTWCMYRLQNQRNSIRINRVLDVISVGLELLKWVR